MKALNVIAVLLGMGLLYLLVWPIPIDPAPWQPPEAPPFTGPFAPNTRLAAVDRVDLGGAIGAEDVAIDSEGRIYGGVEDGRIVRILPGGNAPETFAETGGRPLGLDFDAAGHLIVADGERGLLSVNRSGGVTVLATEHDGRAFHLTDDVDVAPDGTVFFTDASSKFGVSQTILDLMEHRPNGRLLAYDPGAAATRLVLDSLYFANGVAVSPDQAFVLVNETGKYRVRRVWLDGSRAGEVEVFVDNLPGFPDGISSNGQGTYWLALVSPRQTGVDRRLLPHPWLRRIAVRLPDALLPAAEDYGFVLGLDATGTVTHNLQDPSGSFAQISSVEEHAGTLYLGSLVEPSIGRLPAPAVR